MTQSLEASLFLGDTQNPAPSAPLSPSHNENPEQSSVDAAISLLADAWPAKGRNLAQLRLAGGLIAHGWSDEETLEFLCSVCRLAGNEDPGKRATTVRLTREKADAGVEYAGWPRLEENVGAEVVARVRSLLGMAKVDITPMEGFGEGVPAVAAGDEDDPLNVITHGKRQKIDFEYTKWALSQSPSWKGVFRFNVLTRKHAAVNPPILLRMVTSGGLSDGDVGKIRGWFATQGCTVLEVDVRKAVATICEERGRSWNPFAEYLDSLPPATGNLAQVHLTILRVADPFASVLFTKTLVAAVRRARAAPGISQEQPLIDHQGVLVLSGDQGVGKGRLVKILAGKWYSSVDISRLKDKDTVLKCQGSVLVELEEMSTSGAQDRDALKRFLSASDDCERGAYAIAAEKVARTYAMIATTNDARLEDPTGHRRMWPIILTPGQTVDHEAAAALRDALWAEADALAKTDYDHHLTPAEAARCASDAKLLEREDANNEAISDACSGKEFVTIREVYDHMTKGTKKDDIIPRRDEREISDSLRRLGCVKARPTINGLQRHGWKVPEALVSADLSPEGRAYRASLEVAAGLRTITHN